MGYTQLLELIAEAVKLLECRILREVERAELIELAVEFLQCRLFTHIKHFKLVITTI